MHRPKHATQPPATPGLGEVTSAIGTLSTSVADAVEEFLRSISPAREPAHRPDLCEPCDHDDCHCTCCVGDADLVVYTRLFERRVVPIRIQNARRRERQISLELSGFTTKGGRPAPVHGQIIGPTSFTLAGCAEREVTLVLATGTTEEEGEPVQPEDVERAVSARLEQAQELPDVDDCVVAVADLRIEGCDIRPIRIAVPVLPRDCAAYDVVCDCACCG